MQTFKKSLPPLEPLVAFESAARHLSFTAAAKELNLSQAAVSQQIRKLERALGHPLFIRSHRSVRLSAEGRIFQHSASAALKLLATATMEMKTPSKKTRITVSADQSIAAMWLIPRLPNFQQKYPDIAVRLVASDDEQDCLSKDIDIAIIHGDGDWKKFHCAPLFPEEVFPVCSPEYLKLNPGSTSLNSLADQTLLELDDGRWNWMDWRAWLSSNNVHLPVKHRGLRINNYPLLIEAAKNGQGIALGWRYLIDDCLADGSLVRPFSTSAVTAFSYYLVWSDETAPSHSVSVFSDWAKSQLSH